MVMQIKLIVVVVNRGTQRLVSVKISVREGNIAYNFLLSKDGLKYLDDRDSIHVQFSKLMSNKFPTIF